MSDQEGSGACIARPAIHNQEVNTYGNCPVCRATTTRAPYEAYDRIADRVAVNGATYTVLACKPISDLLAGATRATWQVIFRLPTGHDHYVWVDDYGFTPAGMFGPLGAPPALIAEELLAPTVEGLAAVRRAYDNAVDDDPEANHPELYK